MTNQVITQQTIDRRARWLDEIVQISGHFGNDSYRIEAERTRVIDSGSLGIS